MNWTLEQFSILILCVTNRVLSNLHCKFIMSNTLLDPNTESLKRGSKQDWSPLYSAVHKHMVRNIPYAEDFGIQYKMQSGGRVNMRLKVQYEVKGSIPC